MVRVREPLAVLQALGMIHKGHFVYADGSHGDSYVAVSKGGGELTPELQEFCHTMAKFSTDTVEVVVSAPTGGTAIGRCVAAHLESLLGKKIPFVLLEKTAPDNILAIRPEHISLVERKSVLIVDDVLHHGTTISRMLQIVRGIRGKVAGVTAVWNRGELNASDLIVPFLYAPITHKLDSFVSGNCPFCIAGIPVNTDLGHGKEFLAKKSAAG